MKSIENINCIDELTLIRCIIKKDCGSYFKGEDYQGKSYIIMKNHATKHLKKGSDETFYAIKDEKGLIIKKEVFYPVSTKEFENLLRKVHPERFKKVEII